VRGQDLARDQHQETLIEQVKTDLLGWRLAARPTSPTSGSHALTSSISARRRRDSIADQELRLELPETRPKRSATLPAVRPRSGG
jgi:hypothetical protein